MHRERQVFDAAAKRVVVADPSKDVSVIGEKFPAPIEVLPNNLLDVAAELNSMGFDSVNIRIGTGKDGPVITERGNVIIDIIYRAGFTDDVVKTISSINGVFDTGLFFGYDIERLS